MNCMHMLHHLSFAVADLARSAAFYDATLSEVGYVRVASHKTAVGYCLPGDGENETPWNGFFEVTGDIVRMAFWILLLESLPIFYVRDLPN